MSHDINLQISRDIYKTKSMKDIQIYVVVIFLSQLFFIFPLFLRMVMYANEFETREKRKLTKIKNNYSCRKFYILHFSKTRELWSSKANWQLCFSLLSIILADLLGNRILLKRVQKLMVCDLWLVDFDACCVFLCFMVRCL